MRSSRAAMLAVVGVAAAALGVAPLQVMADSKNPPTIKDLEGQQVDVTDEAATRACSAAILARHGRLERW